MKSYRFVRADLSSLWEEARTQTISFPGTNTFRLAWVRTTPRSPLRKIATELMLSRPIFHVALFFHQDMLYPHDFTVDTFWHFAQCGTINRLMLVRSRELTEQNCNYCIEKQVSA